MGLIVEARKGRITDEMEAISAIEGVPPAGISRRVTSGANVIMYGKGTRPIGFGKGLTTKVNVNLGTSSSMIDPEAELEKAKTAVKYGADTISDLSMGGDIDEIRMQIRNAIDVPLTTVPIYQSVAESRSFRDISEGDIVTNIEKQVRTGVQSVVIHAGFDKDTLSSLKKIKRTMGIVSKGGSYTAAWMIENDAENPMLTNFEDILGILAEWDVVLNLGNTMRSGCVHDQRDPAQQEEIIMNSKLAKRANDAGVQVIVEGLGGHVNAGSLASWIAQHKMITGGRPLFVAGPLPTDIAVGHDHIAAAIGGAVAAAAGADYLCSITPAEHLALPTTEHVREGVIACRIAAHVGDSVKYGLSGRDLDLAKRRAKRDLSGQIENALDPEKPLEIRDIGETNCSMCGAYCALALMERYLFSEAKNGN